MFQSVIGFEKGCSESVRLAGLLNDNYGGVVSKQIGTPHNFEQLISAIE